MYCTFSADSLGTHSPDKLHLWKGILSHLPFLTQWCYFIIVSFITFNREVTGKSISESACDMKRWGRTVWWEEEAHSGGGGEMRADSGPGRWRRTKDSDMYLQKCHNETYCFVCWLWKLIKRIVQVKIICQIIWFIFKVLYCMSDWSYSCGFQGFWNHQL